MVQKKSKPATKKKVAKGFFQKHKNLTWLLPVLVLVVSFFVLHPAISAPKTQTASKTTYKTYSNKIGTVTLQYPSTWTVKEMHTLSNRAVDNPDEINTGVLSGKEGQVTVEWGPMGFGGGCNQWSTLALKNKSVQVCDVVYSNGEGNDDGSENWGGISNGHNDETITEVRATAYKPLNENAETVKAILSSITFN
jgi:hypothetical protein